MGDDPMQTERDWYDTADFDISKMRRVHLRRTAGTGPLSTFAVRLEGEVIDRLRQIADRNGIGPTQLVREWILDRLASESPPPTDDSRPMQPSPVAQPISAADLSRFLRPIVREIVTDELRAAKRKTTLAKAPAKKASKTASSKAVAAKRVAAKKTAVRRYT
jgi:hypothetical protein